MSVHSRTKDMTEWTCSETISSFKGTATAAWGNTAIQGLPRARRGNRGKHQHWWPWANGFLPDCDRDEWPPRVFWQKKPPPTLSQRIRLIPAKENQAAGRTMLRGFCAQNNADYTENNFGTKTTWVQSKFISRHSSDVVTGNPGKGGTTSKFTRLKREHL
jgi:hypothetical protein